ncbi:hypothetical protein UFOVP350_44 [uncultured Caudovirales phage]|uniref:Uncharacterized protein n=1 Tax=uncultured Caudovirales phage TaxID=2100421 RepID=A0A6J5LWY4_9CAUD|nr:hypothetical protein UFOVP350_44 [uncultured Caudovirales phage]
MMGAYKSRLAQVISDATAVCYHPAFWYMKLQPMRKKLGDALGMVWALSLVAMMIMLAAGCGWWALCWIVPMAPVWVYTWRMRKEDAKVQAMQENVLQYILEEYGTKYQWEEVQDLVMSCWITQTAQGERGKDGK